MMNPSSRRVVASSDADTNVNDNNDSGQLQAFRENLSIWCRGLQEKEAELVFGCTLDDDSDDEGNQEDCVEGVWQAGQIGVNDDNIAFRDSWERAHRIWERVVARVVRMWCNSDKAASLPHPRCIPLLSSCNPSCCACADIQCCNRMGFSQIQFIR